MAITPDALKRRIDQALGKARADLVVKGTRFLDVASGEIRSGDVAIGGATIVGTCETYSGIREIDGRDLVVVPGVIDTEKERDRLQRDLKKLEKELGVLEKKLRNPSFVERAPEAVVEKSNRDATELREKRERLEAALNSL